MNYKSIITITAERRGGKPCVRDLRITVYDVLEHLASGATPSEIIEDFPELHEQDIQACLAFAADRDRQLAELNVG